jgi:hypothetical protein
MWKFDMEIKIRITLCITICITLIVISIFIWPTIYYYDKQTLGSFTGIVRINRFTGNADVLIPYSGWTSWMGDNTEQSNKEPWNDKTITTIYEGLRVEQKGYLSFGYYVYNNTDTDYEIIGSTGLKLMVSMSDGSIAEDESLKTNMLHKLFLPSKMKQFITIHLEGLTIPASVNKNDVKAIGDYLNDKFKNFNGFILFDTIHRYKVVFPKGW